MPIYSVMPDIEAVALAALRAADVCDGHCFPSIPANPTYPVAVAERLGGLPVEKHRVDRARIQVSVWGENKADAWEEAEAARRALLALQDATDDTFDCFVTAVEDELGLMYLPDPDNMKDRYIFSLAITAHAV